MSGMAPPVSYALLSEEIFAHAAAMAASMRNAEEALMVEAYNGQDPRYVERLHRIVIEGDPLDVRVASWINPSLWPARSLPEAALWDER